MTAALAAALRQLAAVPPKAFVRERNALATRLREAGETKIATQVKARRVPTLPVWIVNRLALEHAAEVEALIAAGDRVKAAQLGRVQAGPLATATAGHRAALERLRERTGDMLRTAGVDATPDKLLRVQRTLSAAAVNPQARAALRAGLLEQELTAPGFDVFGGARPTAARLPGRRAEPAASPATPAPVATTTTARRARVSPEAATRPAMRQRAEEAERVRRRAWMEGARTARAAAEQEADTARRVVTETKGRLGALLEQVQQTRQALRESTTALRRQERLVTRAQRVLRTAERRAGGGLRDEA